MLSYHVIYTLRGSPGILHGHSLSHYWECIGISSSVSQYWMCHRNKASCQGMQLRMQYYLPYTTVVHFFDSIRESPRCPLSSIKHGWEPASPQDMFLQIGHNLTLFIGLACSSAYRWQVPLRLTRSRCKLIITKPKFSSFNSWWALKHDWIDSWISVTEWSQFHVVG